jgi:hypothetical protein
VLCLGLTLTTGFSSDFTTGSTFDAAGNFYVTAIGNNKAAQFNSSGTPVDAAWTTGPGSKESIVFDLAGNAYTGNAGTSQILKVSCTGTALARHTVNSFRWRGGAFPECRRHGIQIVRAGRNSGRWRRLRQHAGAGHIAVVWAALVGLAVLRRRR